jgi:hypothetical protein
MGTCRKMRGTCLGDGRCSGWPLLPLTTEQRPACNQRPAVPLTETHVFTASAAVQIGRHTDGSIDKLAGRPAGMHQKLVAVMVANACKV